MYSTGDEDFDVQRVYVAGDGEMLKRPDARGGDRLEGRDGYGDCNCDADVEAYRWEWRQ